MKIVLVLLLAVVLALCDEKRLIFLPKLNTKLWMSPEHIEKMARPGQPIDFIDITEEPSFSLAAEAADKKEDFPAKPQFPDVVKPLVEKVSVDEFTRIMRELENNHGKRTCRSDNGQRGAEFIKNYFQSIIDKLPEERKQLFNVRFFKAGSYKQQTVIAQMKGSSDEVVIVGGHIDVTPGPGSDDNGSGSATVMEAFRVIAESNYVPKKTLEFHGYSCEEIGLVGSGYVSRDYKSRGVKVYGMMNFDMTAYLPTQTIGLITNSVSKALTQFTRTLIDEYCKIKRQDTTLTWGSSDSASWRGQGFHAAWPFEHKVNPNIHSGRDKIDKLNLPLATEYIKLAVAWLVEGSNY